MENSRIENGLEKVIEIADKVGHIACNAAMVYGGVKIGVGAVEHLMGSGGPEGTQAMVVGIEAVGFGFFMHKFLDFEHRVMSNKNRLFRRGMDNRGEV